MSVNEDKLKNLNDDSFNCKKCTHRAAENMTLLYNMDNILRFVSFTRFICHVRSDWSFTNTKKKNSKDPSKSEEDKFKKSFWKWRTHQFMLSLRKVGLRLNSILIAVFNMITLNKNVKFFYEFQIICHMHKEQKNTDIGIFHPVIEKWWFLPNSTVMTVTAILKVDFDK